MDREVFSDKLAEIAAKAVHVIPTNYTLTIGCTIFLNFRN
jgi:hypothetical protein